MANRRTGFTLIESLLALLIGSLVMLSVGLTVQQLHRDQTTGMIAATQLDNAILHLTDERRSAQYISNSSSEVRLSMKPSEGIAKVHTLKASRGQLMLSTIAGGYMPLVEKVSSAQFRYDKSCLIIELVLFNHQHVIRQIVLPMGEV
ncbi:type II secretion system protein [Furfurilactobacillus siliginis]|uniref:Prepilin-type N-terminal cleavage/methylation domain-containing protein n=1 Tax=Furfurilactobacillus siliginis TaxID=348151 RepID=A0A0R2KVT9_9LACO|nr:type II secretion system protein [Furfurilactobacillus siliginis]KRN93582.1 hypothetical protein IV55_GL001001 [Furfurilactobacillus siliginis]GEK29238.1 hypothetical protein LSI01_15490 [Furfurilactobacillus siliginis]